jgi:hypothetical protein
MPKRSVNWTIDVDVIEAIKKESGLIPDSTYVNYILKLIFSEEEGFAEEIRALMEAEKSMGPIPEYLRSLLRECLDGRLREHGLK